MPHDRKGAPLQKGDRVLVPVRPVAYLRVQPNVDTPDELGGSLVMVETPTTIQVEAEIMEIWPQEHACNAEFKLVNGLGSATFNTRLVEKKPES